MLAVTEVQHVLRKVARCSSRQMSSGPLLEYQKLVQQGKLAKDPTQQVVVAQLDSLHSQLRSSERAGLVPGRNVSTDSSKANQQRSHHSGSSFMSSVFSIGSIFGSS